MSQPELSADHIDVAHRYLSRAPRSSVSFAQRTIGGPYRNYQADPMQTTISCLSSTTADEAGLCAIFDTWLGLFMKSAPFASMSYMCTHFIGGSPGMIMVSKMSPFCVGQYESGLTMTMTIIPCHQVIPWKVLSLPFVGSRFHVVLGSRFTNR